MRRHTRAIDAARSHDRTGRKAKTIFGRRRDHVLFGHLIDAVGEQEADRPGVRRPLGPRGQGALSSVDPNPSHAPLITPLSHLEVQGAAKAATTPELLLRD